MPQQLNFDLPLRHAMGRSDFMVAPSNAVALALMDQTPRWALQKLVLSGPRGSGKTHLTHVWATDLGAQIVQAQDLTEHDVPHLATGPVAVEDVPCAARNEPAQTALFHLHNMMFAQGWPLLMTGTGAPNLWAMSLPDLQSRIDAATVATLDAPSDALLAALLAKHFDDRQLHPPADLIPWLLLRMDRSFAAARDTVAALDHACLTQQRKLTRSFAGQVLDKTTSSGA